MDKTQFIKLHLSRLVNLFVPEEFGYEYTQRLLNELTKLLTLDQTPAFTNSTAELLHDYEQLFVKHGRSRDWSHFKIIIQILGEKKLSQDIAKYLTFLSHMLPDSGTFSSPLRHDLIPILAREPSLLFRQDSSQETRASSPNVSSASFSTPALQEPDDQAILTSLQYTLLGQNTQLLSFLPDSLSIEIPLGANKSFSHLLADLLEPALMFNALQRHLEGAKGNERSPIKTAFLRSLESYLKDYASFVQIKFTNGPTSLFTLFNDLTDQIRTLRLLSYLNDRQITLDGFQFLEEVFKVSQSGDLKVSEIAQNIFGQIVVPYYEYIEHWIVKGRLIDENNEFFVSFNTGENHVNDIIAFDATKLPTFMRFEKNTFAKILQIGKTVIFLEKYCEELEWVDEFALKYFALLFTSNDGLQSMSSSAIQELIDAQFDEAVNYLSYLMQDKYHLFEHLLYMKKVMLMEASDLIENINKTGALLFSQPAMSLTSGNLSDILDESIAGSSLKAIPRYFRDRVDARILNFSHGTVGWDVFTLDYKIPEASLEAVLNYKNDSTQYLRLFNFLWSLRHFQFIMQNSYTEYRALHKNDISIMKQRCGEGIPMKMDLKRLQWFKKSVRMINIIRNRMFLLLQAVIRYVSFSLIERSFNSMVVQKMFKNNSAFQSSMGLQYDTPKLPVLSAEYAAECTPSNELQKARAKAIIKHIMRDFTVDDLTTMHSEYLHSITNCKLLQEDVRGRHSGLSFVDQIFAFLEMSFSFVKASEEFGALLNNYVNLYSVLSGESTGRFEDGLEETYSSMKILMRRIYHSIFLQKFEPALAVFVKDLRSEAELKDLGKFI